MNRIAALCLLALLASPGSGAIARPDREDRRKLDVRHQSRPTCSSAQGRTYGEAIPRTGVGVTPFDDGHQPVDNQQ